MLEYLKFVHGFYNVLVMVLLFFQGWLGISIRRARRSQAPLPVKAVKRHRKMGPILALLGALGFLVGLVLVLVDTGRVLEYPPHLFVGMAIVILLISTFLISRKIKGPDSPFRTPHFRLGLFVLLPYIVQSFLGLGVLF
jgi:Protein of unknown function (DUF4079)